MSASTNKLRKQATKNLQELRRNPYPGRGIILGCNEEGEYFQVYWIMGRSASSRGRVFRTHPDDGRVFTEPTDPSKPVDPLTIYNAMLGDGERYAVSNGLQTDTVFNSQQHLIHPMKNFEYEPDGPNFTPRITGVMMPGRLIVAELAILRKSPVSDACERFFYTYEEIPEGFGYLIHTYAGDGKPLPAFSGEPRIVPIEGTPIEIGQMYWDALNEENRVSLVVKRLGSPRKPGIHIWNKYEPVTA